MSGQRREIQDKVLESDEIVDKSIKHGSAKIVTLVGGGYIIVWNRYVENGSKLIVQRYNNNGSAIGKEREVAIGIIDSLQSITAVALADGGYTIAWKDYDYSRYTWYLQRFDEKDMPVDNQVVVISHNKRYIDIVLLDNGGYYVSRYDDEAMKISTKHYDRHGDILDVEKEEMNAYAEDMVMISLRGGAYVRAWHGWCSDVNHFAIHVEYIDDNHLENQSILKVERAESLQLVPFSDGSYAVIWKYNKKWHLRVFADKNVPKGSLISLNTGRRKDDAQSFNLIHMKDDIYMADWGNTIKLDYRYIQQFKLDGTLLGKIKSIETPGYIPLISTAKEVDGYLVSSLAIYYKSEACSTSVEYYDINANSAETNLLMS